MVGASRLLNKINKAISKFSIQCVSPASEKFIELLPNLSGPEFSNRLAGWLVG